MRSRYKRWAEPFLSSHPDIVINIPQKEDPFFKNSTLFLEIGAGKGDFVVTMAKKFPLRHFLALERDISIAGVLAKKVVDNKMDNIRVIASDFDTVFPSLSFLRFSGIYLNFSDPWPKKRHWKRRLTTRERLASMATLLTVEGRLYFKTDNDSLYEFTKEEATFAPLSLVTDIPDYQTEEIDDAMTEYEAEFRKTGHPIHRLVYSKKAQ